MRASAIKTARLVVPSDQARVRFLGPDAETGVLLSVPERLLVLCGKHAYAWRSAKRV